MSAAFSRPVYRSTVDRHVGHVVMETSRAQAYRATDKRNGHVAIWEGTHSEWKCVYTHTHIAREPEPHKLRVSGD